MEKRSKELDTQQRQLYKKMLGTAGSETAAGKREVGVSISCFMV